MIIDHLVDNKKAYFIASIIALLAMVSQIRLPGFNSSFDELGIKENIYIDDVPFIDSTFQTQQHLYVMISPRVDFFGEVIKDMEIFSKEIKKRFPESNFQTPTSLTKLMYSQKLLDTISVSKVLTKLSTVELVKESIALNTNSFLVKIGVDKDDQAVVRKKVYGAWEAFPNHKNYDVSFTGLLLLEDAMNMTLQKDLIFILALLFICFSLIMYVSYRSVFATVYLLSMVTVSLLIGVFVYTLSGFPFTFIGIMVLPVVVVLAAANAVHLLTGYFSIQEDSPDQKLKKLYKKYLIPSFFTTLTTSFAFFTLMFTTTVSVYTLGWVCGLTILINFVICFAATPFVMQFAPKRNIRNHPFSKIASFFINNKRIFAFLLMPLLFISIALLPQLTFKNNFELFVPKNSDAREAVSQLTSEYYIQSDLNIILEGSDSLKTIGVLKDLRSEFEELEELKSILDVSTNSVVFTPLFLPINLASLPIFKKEYESSRGKIQRIQLKTANPQDLIQVESKINQILKGVPSTIKLRKSSAELMYEYVNKEVAESLIKSMLSSSLFLFFVFLFLTRSFLQSFIGLFVNLVPLSMIVILFILFDLQLNIMTSITAIVCLGLIVDDTIHSFYRRVVMGQELKELSFGMLTTTIILTTGFGAFAISSLQPVVIFGGIAAIIFVVTLISDFTLLLYLIELYDKKFGLKDQKKTQV